MKQLLWSNPDTIDFLEQELQRGNVVLAQGDTVLGLLADLSDAGYAKLDSIKSRSNKPYLILVENCEKALNFIEKGEGRYLQVEKLMNVCWPGPVTLIFPAKATVGQHVISTEGTVALRVPDHAGLLKLLHRFDGLFSTSANTSGKPVPATIEEVEDSISNSIACIVLNDNHTERAVPSTILDCTGERIVVVRQGAFHITDLLRCL